MYFCLLSVHKNFYLSIIKDNSVIVPGIYSDKIDLLQSSFEITKFKSSGFLSSLSHERHSQGKFLELGIMPLTEFRKRIF